MQNFEINEENLGRFNILPRDIIFDIFDILAAGYLNDIIKNIFLAEANNKTDFSEKRIFSLIPQHIQIQILSKGFYGIFTAYKECRPAKDIYLFNSYKCCDKCGLHDFSRFIPLAEAESNITISSFDNFKLKCTDHAGYFNIYFNTFCWNKLFAFNNQLPCRKIFRVLLYLIFVNESLISTKIIFNDLQVIIDNTGFCNLENCETAHCILYWNDIRMKYLSHFYDYRYNENENGYGEKIFKISKIIKKIIPREWMEYFVELLFKFYRSKVNNCFDFIDEKEHKNQKIYLSAEYENEEENRKKILENPDFSIKNFISSRVYDMKNYPFEGELFINKTGRAKHVTTKPKINYILELYLRMTYLYLCGRNDNVENFIKLNVDDFN